MRDPIIEHNRQLSIKAWVEQGKRTLNESFKNTPIAAAGSGIGSGGVVVGPGPDPGPGPEPPPVPVSANLILSVDIDTDPYTFGFEITTSTEKGLTVVVDWNGVDITTDQVAAGSTKHIISYNYTSADIFTPVIVFSDVSAVEGLFFDWPVDNSGSGRINNILNSDLVNLTALTELSFTENSIPELNLSGLNLQTITVNDDSALGTLIVESSIIGELSVTSCNGLNNFSCGGSEFTDNLVISNCKALSFLSLASINILRGLDISENANLDKVELPSGNNLAGEGIIITTYHSPITSEDVDSLIQNILNSGILTGSLDLRGSGAPGEKGLVDIVKLNEPPREWTVLYTV